MPDFNITNQYSFLDQNGVRKLAKGLLDIVNTRIAERITLNVDSNSDEMHVPSAAAVYRAIINSKHLKVKIVTGNINSEVPLNERSSDVIYWQRDTQEDTKWMIYVWVNDTDANSDLDGTWICLGDTEINLDNYWSKSDSDVASMKYVLGINDINTTISTLATKDELNTKVNEDDLDAILISRVQEILEEAEFETEIFYNSHNLTINWVYPDGVTPIAAPYTGEFRTGQKYDIKPPVVDDFYASSASVKGTMPDENLTITVKYNIVIDEDEPNRDLLIIKYVDNEGNEVAPTVGKAIAVDGTYSVASPVIDGYIADKPTVTGTMVTGGVSEIVTYTVGETPKATLTINYVGPEGDTEFEAIKPETYTAQIPIGGTYSVTSPEVGDGSKYYPTTKTVTGTMVEDGITVDVTYDVVEEW